jgi:putative transposase
MRGNNRAPLFFADDDQPLFLRLLRATAARFDWALLLWCLMTNHIHLLIETKTDNLARGMHRLNTVYAQTINDRHRRKGHLFEKRYFSRPIESEPQFDQTALYVVNNPVEAGLCATARDWPGTGGELAATILDM